jgi:hypothetical protein
MKSLNKNVPNNMAHPEKWNAGDIQHSAKP